MHTTAVMFAALAMAACGGGVGPAGPAGAPGLPGAAGASADGGTGGSSTPAAKVSGWYDATGAFVSPDSAYGPIYVDARGFIWFLDHEHADIYVVSIDQLYFVTSDCTGQAYASFINPLQPFKLAAEDFFRVRTATTLESNTTLHSTKPANGTCSVGSFAVYYSIIPLDGTTVPAVPIVKPTVGYAPPLHLEVK